MRLGVRSTLLTGFGAVLVTTVIVGVAGLVSLRAAADIAGAIYVERVVPIRDVAQSRAALGQIDSQILRAIVTESPGRHGQYAAEAEHGAATIDQMIALYEASELSADGQAQIANYKAAWRAYQETFRGVLRAAAAGETDAATRLYFERAALQYEQLDDLLAQFINANDREAKAASDEITATYGRSTVLIGGLLTVALALGAVIALRYAAQAEQAHRAIAERSDLLVQHARELEEQAVELRASEARNRALLNAIPDSLYRLDRAGTVLERRAPDDTRVRLHAVYEGRTLDDLLGAEIGERLRNAITHTLATAQPSVVEYTWLGVGEPTHREARIAALGPDEVLAVIRDIGERRRAEREREQLVEQLHQARKMEALGQMASGIAHDFNNALTMIVGGAEILQMRDDLLQNEAELRKYLLLIEMAAEDAASVVGRLRELYRPRTESEPFKPLDLAPIVHQSIELTRPRWASQAQAAGVRIEVRTNLDPIPAINGSAAELREALINLIFNAVDAMPNGGVITMTTRAAEECVQLTLTDTGVGMTDEVRQRCLEPFFTTKGERGSGLGLGMVYGVIERHQGNLTIESAVGVGSRMTLSFPHADPATSLVTNGLAAGETPRLQILVVDDEQPICEIVRSYLQADGHLVTITTSSHAALDLLAVRPFDALITDRAMPEMSGDRLVAAARQLRPTLRTIMMTGFGPLMRARDEMPPDVDLLLDKPLRVTHLRQAIVRLLEREPPSVVR